MQIAATPDAPSAHEPSATGTAARDRVFRDVLAHGPVEAGAVARRLEVTPAAVRRHLETLEVDGLVAVHTSIPPGPRGRGRPARAYVVTARGQRAAGAAYEDAALAALSHLSRHYGPSAVAGFADERMAEMEDRWRGTVEAAGPDPAERARALAGALADDGFAADVRPVASAPGTPGGHTSVASGVQICQGHCPVHALAAVHPELCEAETRAFSRLVGAHVQRLATIAHGDHVCTTFVPTPSTSAAPSMRPSGSPPIHPPNPSPTPYASFPDRPADPDPRPEGEPHDHSS